LYVVNAYLIKSKGLGNCDKLTENGGNDFGKSDLLAKLKNSDFLVSLACHFVTDTPWNPRHPWPAAFTPLLRHLSQLTLTPSIDPLPGSQGFPCVCVFFCPSVTL
jgi:hypothetical protein